MGKATRSGTVLTALLGAALMSAGTAGASAVLPPCDETAVTTSLESEGNFRAGYSYEGTPLNQDVGAILDAAPGLVIGTSGPGIPAGFGDELNKQVQALYVGTTPAVAAAEASAAAAALAIETTRCARCRRRWRRGGIGPGRRIGWRRHRRIRR